MIYEKMPTINRLIADLFQLSTLQANRLPFDLKPVAAQLWFESIPEKYPLEAGRRRVTLEVGEFGAADAIGFPPSVAVLVIDALRIEQVVTNLVDNALKHTPEGGTIRLWAELSTIVPETAAEPGRSKEICWFTLYVDDIGPGERT